MNKKKRTKWTPARIVLLISIIVSPLLGIFWPPLAIIMPLLGISTWINTWKNPNYGYRRDGKFDWKEAFDIR